MVKIALQIEVEEPVHGFGLQTKRVTRMVLSFNSVWKISRGGVKRKLRDR